MENQKKILEDAFSILEKKYEMYIEQGLISDYKINTEENGEKTIINVIIKPSEVEKEIKMHFLVADDGVKLLKNYKKTKK